MLSFHRSRLTSAINTGINAIHDGANVTRFAAAPIAEKYLLAKRGADSVTPVVCSAATDLSQGVITDEAHLAGDPINLALHGGADGTRLVRVNVTVAQDDELVPHSTGRAQKLAGLSSGTYYPFGRVITPGNAGDVIEYAPVSPTPRTI